MAVIFDDKSAESGVDYEYQVVVHGLNQTSAASPWVGADDEEGEEP
jgi:hypothetical protein